LVSQAVSFVESSGFFWSRGATRELRRILESHQPDVVLFPIDLYPPALAEVVGALPVAVFVEEDFRRQASSVPRTVRHLPNLVQDRLVRRLKGRANAVAVISDAEREWATRTFGVPCAVVPHSIDLGYWARSGAVAPSAEKEVLVVGDLGSVRNADGAFDVARALDDLGSEVRLTVVSANPPPPGRDLRQFDCVSWAGSVDDLRPFYERCAAVLVPSFAVSGVKTTILQAWAMRVPVVTTTPAAAPFPAEGRAALAIGNTPDEVARLTAEITAPGGGAPSSVRRGAEFVRTAHGISAVEAGLAELIGLASAPVMTDRYPRTPGEVRRPPGRSDSCVE
jgi:glycosyltransferase involved in cell wall biosynthesis